MGINLLLTIDLSLTAVVTGPSVERLHRHSEAQLCIGDALLGFCHEIAGQDCLKTFVYRIRLAILGRHPRESDDGGVPRVCVGAGETLTLDGMMGKGAP